MDLPLRAVPDKPLNNVEWVYLAGPMRGKADFNFPMFDSYKNVLESRGFLVISPADLDRLEGLKNNPEGNSDIPLSTFLKRDIPHLLKCDAICLLPGWASSEGAKAERDIARLCGLRIVRVEIETGEIDD